ncbi:tRNA(Ile)-lysidine synthetase, variant 2 [Aphanomyces astaci]|uniref:tRNA(Ile)-lysidine synthetase n=1 Tax=Aphanomyces astaci TaxID=112090 RepID=W4G8K9_APHAT|nr:tRNA(Ile)-lysidine synthetase, variant 2 [Aphanomyces astaci]ETV75601.1 tRNA(Ile)-lysidine synthetase, variant 2 [Aphanomyces astaci]|eukprot:XP_009834731.1 tRNA(Ile)-lysidine synthetase, variant 2 [Aphanomyces astaci]
MAGLSQVTAVTASAFRQLMESIPKTHRSGRVAIALSGGADSTALLMLLREYVVHPNQVLAVTVDHGLRPESADEARHVASFATKYNIPHQIHRLRWDDIPGKLPRSQLQIQARLRRYSILGDVCTREGIHGLYVGHHLGDQLETLLFRLGRGSGWSGLAGMPAWSLFPVPHPTFSRDLHVVRPLLAVNKAQLKATCNRFGQEWVEDPSNDSEDFDRIRIRKQVRALGALPGSDALEHGLALLQQHAREAHDDLQLAVLTGIVRDVGGKAYPPRVSSVALLLASLQHKTLKRSTTLGGCLVRKKRGCVAFEPEVPQHTLHTTLP